MEGSNFNPKIAFLRDTFLEAEKEYLEELMKIPKLRDFVESLSNWAAEDLATEALTRMSSIETGKVKSNDLERVETEITLLLAAIQDRVRSIGARVRTNDNDEGMER